MRPIAVRVGKEFDVMPACCIHWPHTEKDLLNEWVETLRSKENAYTLLMGDTFDLARTHYRSHIRSYRDDENSQEALDGFARREIEELAKILEPVKHKIWGVMRGNHFWEFQDGTNSEQYLCQLLGLKYLGVIAGIRISCTVYAPDKGNPVIRNLVLIAHHHGGSSGGRTIGGSANPLLRLEAAWDADLHLLGHDHRRMAWKEPVLALSSRGSNVRVLSRDKVFARCGSFVKGFKEEVINATQRHSPAYPEVRALRPSDLGWVTVHVKWKSSEQPVEMKNGRKKKAADTVRPVYTLEY